MATHTLANFPIIPRIILSVLYDNRYFNGNIVNYNQYKRAQKVINPKQTENEIKSSWKQLGLFYDDIITKDGIQSYDYESIAVKLGKSVGEAQEFVDNFHPALASRVKLAVQDIDSAIPQEEKSLAARHGIASFFLTHRSWLLLATQRRFKNRHLNMASGEYEEGSYLTIAEFITDFVKATRKDGMKSFVSNIKKMWEEAEFGQDAQGNAASKKMRSNIIPTYYLKDLKDQKDVTDELLYSYALMNQQASLYQARVDNIGDMLSIKQAVLNDEYNGKEASATNTYKMFQSFMDYNIFGVKETFTYQVDVMGHKVDVARVARGFNSFIKKVNLTGLIVPMTSLFQGSVQKRIETWYNRS